MKFIRNISIKWKVMFPIIILAFLLLVTCIQSNIATARMMEFSEEISQSLTEITPEAEEILAQGVNSFIASLDSVMKQVTLNSEKLYQVTGNVSERVTNVDINSTDISASMQELSATMEEISASIINIRENTRDANDKVEVLANASKDLVAYTDTMEKRAADLESSARCVTDAATNTATLAEDVKAVADEMNENRVIADKLYSETEKFAG